MIPEKTCRDHGLDNIKALMIAFVVFGHCIEELSVTGLWGTARAVIYSFHMPMFIFISGYFSKKDINYARLIGNTLIPYFIFNTLWHVITGGTGKPVNIFLPVYVFWYLLSLFFWRISVGCLSRIRGILIISVLLSLYCGIFPAADRFLSVSRTIVFFPYFLLGFKTDHGMIEKCRSFKKPLMLLLLAADITVTLLINRNGMMPVKMYEGIQSYGSTDVGVLKGILLRGFIYLSSGVYIAALINLIPDRRFKVTSAGVATMTIFLLHPFIIREIVFRMISKDSLLALSPCTTMAVMAAVTAAIILITGNRYTCKAYRAVSDRLTLAIVKETGGSHGKTC